MNTVTAPIPGMEATPAAAWRAYQGVSPSAVDEKDLIERYLPLVRNVVDRIKLNVPAHVDADDLYSVGRDGKSASPLTAKDSLDDIVRGNNGAFVGLAADY